MQSEIVAAFKDVTVKGVQMESAECLFNLCRVQLLFDDLASDIKVFDQVLVKPTKPGGIGALAAAAPTREHLPDGHVRTVLYVARQGSLQFFD